MIHLYRFRGLNIALDVNSGAAHMVSDAVYGILGRCGASGADGFSEAAAWAAAGEMSGEYPGAVLKEAVSEICGLADSGMLFTEETRISDEALAGRGAAIKALCLHASHDCNMRCRYCFGSGGSFSGRRGLMPVEIGMKAIDFLLERSGGRRNLEIDFFGGEPLMNFGAVRQLVAYGRRREGDCGKRIRFTITTNGLLLDAEKEAFINEHMDNVVLSIDGRPEVNDAMRRTAGGGGAYGAVMKNYRRFRENRRGAYYLRGTFTRNNLDFSEDVRHLADLGFDRISAEPVVADAENDFALRDEDLPRLLEEYDRLAGLCLDYALEGRPIDFFHFSIDLTQGPCVFKRVSGCGAGLEYAAVSPEGDIYPCHQFVGKPAFRLGNVGEGSFHNRLRDSFGRAHIYGKPDCAGCWAKFYCGGGCHASAWQANGDIMKPYALGCELERKRVECAIGIQASLAAASESAGAAPETSLWDEEPAFL
ncbi:MAG: thioether cross-link-forming SCIFF peptide maturase [Clostridiales Family XIII bacterium]|jgi:uncharacterized protein|nr:thioether cross-link-forming SCIFF peptide maturase [Clostridiales Family XIII bacterium]